MHALGRILRGLLSINVIWGLMILISFALCVAQQYLPTRTVIPTAALQPGPNPLTIRISVSKGEPADYPFELTLAEGRLTWPAEQGQRRSDGPWLIAAKQRGAGVQLTWDYPTSGKYELLMGGQAVAKGRLVTLQTLTDAAFAYAESAFDLALGLVASMVLFLGLMRIGQDAGLVELIAKAFHPLIRLLFPDVPRDHPASAAILMNWTTTILGLGNAATPFGLKAIAELQKLNKHPDTATDSQVMLLAYNTAGFALLPTTLLALRKSAGCRDPFEIIGTCMLAGLASTVTAIIVAKLLGRLPMFAMAKSAGPATGTETTSSDATDAAQEGR